jgi:hypothetical protein
MVLTGTRPSHLLKTTAAARQTPSEPSRGAAAETDRCVIARNLMEFAVSVRYTLVVRGTEKNGAVLRDYLLPFESRRSAPWSLAKMPFVWPSNW